MVNKLRKFAIKLIPLPALFALLVLVFALGGCGSEQAASADQPFNDSLRPAAVQAAAALSQTSSVMSKCTDYAQQSKPSGGSVMPFGPSGPNKTAEMNACVQEVAQAQTAVTSAANELKGMAPPDGCDTCRSALDALNEALNDASGRFPQATEGLTAGAAILTISEDEMNQLKALPQLDNIDITPDQYTASYNGQSDIYSNTIARWQTVALPAEAKDPAQKFIEAKQTQADVTRKEADGLYGSTQLQMDLINQDTDATMRAMTAVQTVYLAVTGKLTKIEGSINEDKAKADQVVSNLG